LHQSSNQKLINKKTFKKDWLILLGFVGGYGTPVTGLALLYYFSLSKIFKTQLLWQSKLLLAKI
jgi:hypothetical protein